MFKRPSLKVNPHVPLTFVSEMMPNGSVVSRWTHVPSSSIIPSGTTGRVGEIVSLMDKGLPPAKHKPWRPHPDYMKIASYMSDKTQRDEYIQKCKDWYEKNPIQPLFVPKEKPVIDYEPVIQLFKKYSPHLPPIEEHVEVLTRIGCPQASIDRLVTRYNKRIENSEDDQKTIERIFGKCLPVKKSRQTKKVIKAVKKKMSS